MRREHGHDFRREATRRRFNSARGHHIPKRRLIQGQSDTREGQKSPRPAGFFKLKRERRTRLRRWGRRGMRFPPAPTHVILLDVRLGTPFALRLPSGPSTSLRTGPSTSLRTGPSTPSGQALRGRAGQAGRLPSGQALRLPSGDGPSTSLRQALRLPSGQPFDFPQGEGREGRERARRGGRGQEVAGGAAGADRGGAKRWREGRTRRRVWRRYMCSGAFMPISSRERRKTIWADSTSFKRARLTSRSSGFEEMTRQFS